MKVVYDNVIYSLQRAGGISLYWSELSQRLVQRYPHSLFFGFSGANDLGGGGIIEQNPESACPVRIARYLRFMQKVEPGSIFHSSYYRLCQQAGVFNITTVHDFTYERFRRGPALWLHSWQKKQAIMQSAGIICISENTRSDLLELYPQVDAERVAVVHNGVSAEFFQLSDPKAALQKCFPELTHEAYVIFVGLRGGYKNFPLVAKLLCELPELRLVIVGGGPLTSQERFLLSKIKYHKYGFVSREDLNALYNSAFCLLYPSAYEGFGIPVLEAMRAGCPVVAANSSSLPEVGGKAAILCKTNSHDEFLSALTVLQDTTVRANRIQKGLQHAAGFSWDRCFEQTLLFYQRVLNG